MENYQKELIQKIMSDYDFFETIVAGDNPEHLMKPYDKNIKVKPYVVYKFNDAEYLKAKTIDMYTALITSGDLTDYELQDTKELRNDLLKTSAEDFFFDFTAGYDYDPSTNDAISTSNPNGMWSYYQEGKLFSVPFITNDGREVYQAKKGDINWKLMHLNGKEIYESAWDMVMGNKKPKTNYEKQIYENMKNRTAYFQKFENKENYVLHSTAFWSYAFVDEKGWYELQENVSQFDWVKNFYNKFIKPLPNDTLLTIFECKK